jgi:pimeloyl-ACP methyl ester carboxylesterase
LLYNRNRRGRGKPPLLLWHQLVKVIAFEKAGHWLHHEQFERFITTLRNFLWPTQIA